MAKHRAGDRRIMSISIPEKLAERLDRRVGKGRRDGRSDTITRMIQESLDGWQKGPPATAVEERKIHFPPSVRFHSKAPSPHLEECSLRH